MKTLFVNACIRKESRTRMLAEYLLKRLDQDYVELLLQKEFQLFFVNVRHAKRHANEVERTFAQEVRLL